MRILGVEINAAQLNYVLVELQEEGKRAILGANRLSLADTRSRSALGTFQRALLTLLNEADPELIAIKLKPESGRLRAGAAALKIEGLLLANARCEVAFISGAKINKIDEAADDLHEYLQAAFRTAVAAAQ